MAQRTTFKKKEMDKNEFIDSLYEIAQGNKTTYYGQTGWKAVEEILASDNRMTVQVKYDAILTKIKKEHNIIAKNIIPQLSELLHMAEFDDRRLVRKILHDFGSVWSRSTIYENIPDKYTRNYTQKHNTQEVVPKSDVGHSFVGFCLKCDQELEYEEHYCLCNGCGAFLCVSN